MASYIAIIYDSKNSPMLESKYLAKFITCLRAIF